MTQNIRIVGTVEYRVGDGPVMQVRKGPAMVKLSDADAILSWSDETYQGLATMPLSDFQRYVKTDQILLDGPDLAQV